MNRIASVVISVLLMLIVVASFAEAKSDPKVDYITIETENFYVHYPSGMEEQASEIARVAETMREQVGKKLGWYPKGKTHIALADTSDLANGFTTVFPYKFVQLFNASPGADEALSYYDDWLNLLISHEYTHVAHLDQTGGVPKVLRYMLGSLISMNSLEPSWMVEGMGTYFETQLTDMGRGRSTYSDMMLRMAVLDGRLGKIDQVGGGLIKWPGGEGAYIYGESFLQFLADKYGEEKVMAFSKRYSSRIIPFRMNAAARKVFGKNFIKLWDEWRDALKKKYNEQAEKVKKEGLTEYTKLTDQGFWHKSPKFTPDGNRIVFYHRGPHGKSMIKVADINTHKVDDLFGANPFGSIDVSKEGDKVVYSSFSRGEGDMSAKYYMYFDIYTNTMDGKNLETITKSARAFDPCFAPDGKIYFVRRLKNGGTDIAWVEGKSEGEDESKDEIVPQSLNINLGKEAQISGLACSQDGLIAFSAWTEGGYRDIYLLDTETSELTRITNDKAMDTYPVFSDDGNYIFFSSDRTGISNIYKYKIKADKLFRITNVMGGAFQPSPSPDSSKIAFLNYSSYGYDVVYMDARSGVTVERLLEPISDIPEYDNELAKPAEKDLPTAGAKKYSPWSSLLPPRFLIPIIVNDGVEASFGAFTANQDALQKHFYSLSAYYGSQTGFLSWGAVYGLNTFEPTFILSGMDYSVPYGDNTIIELKDVNNDGFLTVPAELVSTDENYFEEHIEAEAGVSMELNVMDLSFTLMGFYHYEEHDNINTLPDLVWEELTPFRGKLVGLRFAFLMAGVRAYGYSISPEDGIVLFSEVEIFDEGFGGDVSQQVLTADLRLFKSIPFMPDHHVLAIRAGGGTTWGDDIYPGHFRVGGTLGNSLISGADEKYFLLRGFSTSQFVGESALVINSEYRFPIAYPERGWGLKPFFLRAIHAALFADIGNVYIREDTVPITIAGKKLINPSTGTPLTAKYAGDDEFEIGAGAELRADVLIGWGAMIGGAMTFRLGYATEVQGEGIGPLIYLDLGTTF